MGVRQLDDLVAYQFAEEFKLEAYGLASLWEARSHLRDGVHRGYFLQDDCRLAFTWASRCRVVLVNFLASQRRLIAADEARARAARLPRKRRRTS